MSTINYQAAIDLGFIFWGAPGQGVWVKPHVNHHSYLPLTVEDWQMITMPDAPAIPDPVDYPVIIPDLPATTCCAVPWTPPSDPDEAVIPEPGTYALLAMGIVLLAIAKKWKAQISSAP